MRTYQYDIPKKSAEYDFVKNLKEFNHYDLYYALKDFFVKKETIADALRAYNQHNHLQYSLYHVGLGIPDYIYYKNSLYKAYNNCFNYKIFVRYILFYENNKSKEFSKNFKRRFEKSLKHNLSNFCDIENFGGAQEFQVKYSDYKKYFLYFESYLDNLIIDNSKIQCISVYNIFPVSELVYNDIYYNYCVDYVMDVGRIKFLSELISFHKRRYAKQKLSENPSSLLIH
jgi:hypothetical protein